MSTQTIRILIAGALLVHGIGHTLGFWKPARSFPFLTVSDSALKMVGGITWIVIAISFIIASMSFYGILAPASWWRPLVIIFSIVSLVGLILFGKNWPIFNFVSATALNVAMLIALLWLGWPPVELFNR